MIPVDYSEVGAVGATNASPITVSGIAASDILLACIAWDPTANGGADPTGIDVSEGTVGNGTVTLSTTDTTDMVVWFMWAKPS